MNNGKNLLREDPTRRLLVVQYAGDFRRAHRELIQSGSERYYGHSYVLDVLAEFAARYGDAGIMCCRSDERYSERLSNGVTVIGAGADPQAQASQIIPMLEAFRPTHVAVLGPLTKILKWAMDRDLRVIGVFADSFESGWLRQWRRYGNIRPVLRDQRLEWIANHNVSASLSLERFGAPKDRIIPWDWPYPRHPNHLAPKTHPGGIRGTMLYAGSVVASKGVGDIISGVALLKRSGAQVDLKVCGGGDIEGFRTLARRLEVADRIEFRGLVPNSTVAQMMRDADGVVVPSRHSYPEGLPLTIYEALCARTPLVASDHPMFARHLRDGESALIFRAGRAAEFASKVRYLLGNPDVYAKLSIAASTTWDDLQVSTKWGDILSRWISDTSDDQTWLRSRTLYSGMYQTRP